MKVQVRAPAQPRSARDVTTWHAAHCNSGNFNMTLQSAKFLRSDLLSAVLDFDNRRRLDGREEIKRRWIKSKMTKQTVVRTIGCSKLNNRLQRRLHLRNEWCSVEQGLHLFRTSAVATACASVRDTIWEELPWGMMLKSIKYMPIGGTQRTAILLGMRKRTWGQWCGANDWVPVQVRT